MKKYYLIILLVLSLFITGCNNEEVNEKESEVMEEMQEIKPTEITDYKDSEEITNYVKIEMENKDEIIIELYPEIAPITVENFQKLVDEKFYDGLLFHRVIEGFMVQTGDPEGTGMGGSDKEITGEFQINGINNTLSHTRGVISMARRGGTPETSETMNSASSQFFIVHEDSQFLDKNYAAFGQVIKGMENVDKIAVVETNSSDKPTEDQIMKKVSFVEISKAE